MGLSLATQGPPPLLDFRQQTGLAGLDQGEYSPALSNPLHARNQSDTSLYSPIRRRSLLQHGIATRPGWVENEPRQPLPGNVNSHNDELNLPSSPTKPPPHFPELASLAPKIEDFAVGPRAETPSGSEYGQIGAFKLGSLRITNGAASPVPSDGKSTIAGGEEDHGSSSERMASLPRHRSDLNQQDNNTLQVPHGIVKAPWNTRTDSPLRYEDRGLEDPKIEVPEVGVRSHDSLTINTSAPAPELSLFEFKFSESPTKSQELANEYMQDLALSPFDIDAEPATSPEFQATSKSMAVDDDLFEPEPRTPEPDDFHMADPFAVGHQDVDGLEEAKVDLISKLLAQVNNGYGYLYNPSLHSFEINNPPQDPEKDTRPGPPAHFIPEDASSTYSIYSTYSTYSTISAASNKSDATIGPLKDQPSIRPVSPSESEYSTIKDQRSVRSISRSESEYSTIKDQRSIRSITPPESEYSTIYAPSTVPDSPIQTRQSLPTVFSNLETQRQSFQMPSPAPVKDSVFLESHQPPPVQQPHRSPEEIRVVEQSTPCTNGQGSSLGIPTVSPGIQKNDRSNASPSVSEDPTLPAKLGGTGTSHWRSLSISKSRSQAQLSTPVYPPPSTASQQRQASHVAKEASRRFPKPKRYTLAGIPNSWNGNIPHKRTVSKETLGTIFSVGSAEWREEAAMARLQSGPDHSSVQINSSPKQELNRGAYGTPAPAAAPMSKTPVRHTLGVLLRNDNHAPQRHARHNSENPIATFASVPSNLGKLAYDGALRDSNHVEQGEMAEVVTEGSAWFGQVRNVSQEIQDPQPLRRTTSYDQNEPLNQNTSLPPKNPSRGSPFHDRPRSNNKPRPRPQTHRSSPNLSAELGKLSVERVRNQRSLHGPRMSAPSEILDAMLSASTIPPAAHEAPSRPLPQLPTPHHPLPKLPSQKDIKNQWQEPDSPWINEALQRHKLIEGQRRPKSTKPIEHRRPQLNSLSHHMSFDSRPAVDQELRDYELNHKERPGSYDPTYSQHWSNKENTSPTNHYSGREERDAQPPRRPSTPEMVILDRYAGGLGYGYEPGFGIGGSAGTRNTGRFKPTEASRKSVRESELWGVDLTDVPVFLQRVKVGA